MKSGRIRRVKRLLRPLPRRSNIHKYPGLRLFSDFTRKRMYLWSFRVENVTPSIYAGCILTLLPLFGIQIPLALLLAILLNANLPILVGLQIISNPFTIFPIWFSGYQVGHFFLAIFGVHTLALQRSDVKIMLDNFSLGNWGHNWGTIFSVYGLTCLGALIMGSFIGLVASLVYKMAAKRSSASYASLIKKIHDHNIQKSQREV